ncbi:MAG: TerC family protein [Candidatus Obscuribacterales bacterium]|jgi:predicted tellurium resistance membrane protein TerC|nr:TerC family protein [Candidatus Obscuribacterales bacterium]
MELFYNPEAWAALATLTLLEVVLGIDNIVFISILSSKLPSHQQAMARLLGLGLAMISRIALLFSIVWVMSLTKSLFTFVGHDFSGRDLILIFGGLFLVAKSTLEMHERINDANHDGNVVKPRYPNLIAILVQIAILDIVFSLDSVITAVGMANDLPIMVAAVVIAVIVMMVFSNWISDFIDRNPTIKVLALSFLLLIGMVLMADGFGQHIQKGYIYSAMAFSLFVEIMNIKIGTRMPRPAVAPKSGNEMATSKK